MKSRKYIIEIENLNKDYMQGGDPVPVLHDINFSILYTKIRQNTKKLVINN